MYKNDVGKGGVYAHEAYEAKKQKHFFCFVNTWDRHRFYTHIYFYKYRALREELRQRYPEYRVRQPNFVIGIQRTMDEHRWRWNLTIVKGKLGIDKRRQDKIIRRCMTASIGGMQQVLRAAVAGHED